MREETVQWTGMEKIHNNYGKCLQNTEYGNWKKIINDFRILITVPEVTMKPKLKQIFWFPCPTNSPTPTYLYQRHQPFPRHPALIPHSPPLQHLLATIDITSLYANIPHTHGLCALEKFILRLPPTYFFLFLTHFIITHNNYSLNPSSGYFPYLLTITK